MSAQTSLESALHDRFPNVTQWTLTPRYSNALTRSQVIDGRREFLVAHVGARSAVRVVQYPANAPVRTQTLWFDVRGEAPVIVLTRPIEIREAIDPSLTTVANRDILSSSCALIERAAQLDGMRARRALRAQSSMCTSDLEQRPSVSRGEWVSVNYRSERISLSTRALAAQDGRLGERVQVVNAASRESFTGYVSGTSEVTIHD